MRRLRVSGVATVAGVHFTEYDTRLAAYAVITNADRILLTWFNGDQGRARPCWTLPGGGVDYHESVEEGLVREVLEETGLRVTLGRVLAVDTTTWPSSVARQRPFKAVRILYEADVIGGSLGTLEVGGTTDHAAWLPWHQVAREPHRADVVDVAIEARRGPGTGGPTVVP